MRRSLRRRAAIAVAAPALLAIAAPSLATTLVQPGSLVWQSQHRVSWGSTTPLPAPTTVPVAGGTQTLRSGLLPDAATKFTSATGVAPDTGWTSLTANASWAGDVGHDVAGALAMTASGPATAVRSAPFPVTPGTRYAATGWVRAASTGRRVGLAFRFFDANGLALPAGDAGGERVVDAASAWQQTPMLIAFAPPSAASARLLFVGYDTAPGEVDWLDDVFLGWFTGAAAPIVAPLSTIGPHVVDAAGRLVHLRGINLTGFEYATWPTAPLTTNTVAQAAAWGANTVRIALSLNFAVPSDCSYTSAYLAKVDSLVAAATARGMLALLDLHTLSLTPCGVPAQQTMPTEEAVAFWQTVAARYAGNPLVAFDLYNEPHDVSDAVWRDGGTTTSNGVTYTAAGMQAMYDAVRSTGARNLVFVGGNNWASSYPSTTLSGVVNVVVAVHAYTCPNGLPSTGAVCVPGPAGITDPTGVLAPYAAVAGQAPVVVTEFGWPDPSSGGYLGNVIGYAESHEFAGWAGYAFDGSTTGMFDLVKDVAVTGEPTPAGMAVMAGLTAD